MTDQSPYDLALSRFLASDTFIAILRDDWSLKPPVTRVLALLPDGKFTVYSGHQDAPSEPDVLVLDIPSGTEEEVTRALRAELRRARP